MQDGRKAVWSIPYVSVAFFSSLKQNFIAYRSSKVSSRQDCIFEIHMLWQPGFSSMYSNSSCSCSFEPEIIKINQSSHKLYSNTILNSQESTIILNACRLIECTTYLTYFHSCLSFRYVTWSPMVEESALFAFVFSLSMIMSCHFHVVCESLKNPPLSWH